MGKHERISSKDRVARRRAALRAQGLRPKQFWVYDTRVPGFYERINEQMRALVESGEDAEEQAWVDSLQSSLELPPWDDE